MSRKKTSITREPLRVKTHSRFTLAPGLMVGAVPIRGDAIVIVGGAFEGMKGTAVEFDGEWITVEVEPSPVVTALDWAAYAVVLPPSGRRWHAHANWSGRKIRLAEGKSYTVTVANGELYVPRAELEPEAASEK